MLDNALYDPTGQPHSKFLRGELRVMVRSILHLVGTKRIGSKNWSEVCGMDVF